MELQAEKWVIFSSDRRNELFLKRTCCVRLNIPELFQKFTFGIVFASNRQIMMEVHNSFPILETVKEILWEIFKESIVRLYLKSI